jgi:hypothetical protein
MAADDPVKFVATVYPVREVSLLGSADFAFWADRLAADHLVPMAIEGEARVMICASDAKYMGIRFRELSISIFCQRQDGNQQEAVYLLQAFNSMRWFAWVERRMFSTPYNHATINIDARAPASLQLSIGDPPIFRARMSRDSPGREPSYFGEKSWAGPVYLPRRRSGETKQGKCFFAKLSGPTWSYTFDDVADAIILRPVMQYPVVQWLIESKFAGKEWTIRENATHAKSKTYRC